MNDAHRFSNGPEGERPDTPTTGDTSAGAAHDRRRVAAGARHWLAPGGSLVVETSVRQAPHTVAAVEGGGLRAVLVRDDERDATVVVGSLVSKSSLSAVTHAVTNRNGLVTP